jgi:hypothetical protein
MNLDVSGVRAMENPKAEGRACRFFAISDHGGLVGARKMAKNAVADASSRLGFFKTPVAQLQVLSDGR